MISTLTSGVAERGSRSSKFAIRFRRGTAILMGPPLRLATSITSSAGSFHASANHGMIPSGVQLVAFWIIVIPSANKVGSPRNLLMPKPRMRAQSSLGNTAWVPTSCAITPPRSMSPIRTTGTFAADAKPMFAMSPARRFTSAGLPAPSMMIRS